MLNLNFRDIRTHNGSKDGGFEELVCQIAHASPPVNAKEFIRTGIGADAGVECFWVLSDGTEHAWQAKYFIDPITDGQWSQVTKSIETALTRHPAIKKYYICFPRNLSHGIQLRNGRQIQTERDKYDIHLNKWIRFAESRGIHVEFELWTEHDIFLRLVNPTDSILYGKAIYWFDIPLLEMQQLRDKVTDSQRLLGDRYSPLDHIDISISRVFDSIILSKEMDLNLVKFLKSIQDAIDSTEYLIKETTQERGKSVLKRCLMRLQGYHQLCLTSNKNGTFFNEYEVLYDKLSDIYYDVNSISRQSSTIVREETNDETTTTYLQRRLLNDIETEISRAKGFLKEKSICAGASRSMLLSGEAGIGKSHLLCDLALRLIDDDIPVLFLLGQHYPGGNPINFVRDALGFTNYQPMQILGCLDSFAESRRARFIIIIDAINEGEHNNDWNNHIDKFLQDLSKFENIAVIMSCRSTYLDFILPCRNKIKVCDRDLVQVTHTGFKGNQHYVVASYLNKQGVVYPVIPFVIPEFENPLFLKLCCKSIKAKGESHFPEGLNGFNALFEYYISCLEENIANIKRYRKSELIVKNVLSKITEEMYPEKINGLSVSEARNIVNNYDPNPSYGESLFNLLIDEGILSYDCIGFFDTSSTNREIVKFTYEKFSDYSIAKNIINKCSSIKELERMFDQDGDIGKIILSDKKYIYAGIFEALGICIPEKFNREFMEFLSLKDESEYEWFLDKTFKSSILWRSGKTVNEKSIELLNRICNGRYFGKLEDALDILISLSTEPEHPWNAIFLDRILKEKPMPERDSFWSTYIAINTRQNRDDTEQESRANVLIDWGLKANLKLADNDRLYLLTIVLLWMTTTSCRHTRWRARKSLARVLSFIPCKINDLISGYTKVDDVYLVESLYGAVYGAVLSVNKDDITQSVAMAVFENIFNDVVHFPQLQLRDYARGILEYAYHKKLLKGIDGVPEKFRPPYSSKWPLENVSLKEIDDILGDRFSNSIKRSLLGGLNDFGNYTMECVHYWSLSELSETHPVTWLELQRNFAMEKLHSPVKDKYLRYLEECENQDKRSQTEILEEKIILGHIRAEGLNQENDETIGKTIESILTQESTGKPDAWELLNNEINENISEQDKEYFRWINNGGYKLNQPAAFSRKLAQRWVCKKAHSLGWTKELFEKFERAYSNGDGFERQGGPIERIGKKYQRIAFDELLARMSDNLKWLGRGYSNEDTSRFYGPWQINYRDIDPTIWRNYVNEKDILEKKVYWEPESVCFEDESLEQQISWVRAKDNFVDYKKYLCVSCQSHENRWLILHGFSLWINKDILNKNCAGHQEIWYRINACLVKKKDFTAIRDVFSKKILTSPTLLRISNNDQGYLREYPWHDSYIDELANKVFIEAIPYDNNERNIDIGMPLFVYKWEDESVNSGSSMYLPSTKIIDDMKLCNLPDAPNIWTNEAGEKVFIAPYSPEGDNNYALINADIFMSWMDKNDFQLIWLVGGEKIIFDDHVEPMIRDRMILGGLYTLKDGEIIGESWNEIES